MFHSQSILWLKKSESFCWIVDFSNLFLFNIVKEGNNFSSDNLMISILKVPL